MTTTIRQVTQQWKKNMFRLALLSGISLVVPVFAAAGSGIQDTENAHHGHEHESPARLVEIVRNATRRFIDVNAATYAEYHPFLGCISGPDHGAMGVHYVNGSLVGDGEIDASRPEALIYEPDGGRLRLVGVEFIVDAATWLSNHDSPPVLEGQSFQLVNSPNRYALPAFFELHVWAWRENPNGAFVDWNNRVTCEGQ
ncbi:MAG: hypothetical protein ACJ74Y_18400 [Bryobacteraceae bacterium]